MNVSINGRVQWVGLGSLFFFASNDLHNVTNVGGTLATYHVIRILTEATPPLPKKA